jgi:thiol-disulfide isomerase/thioredoxin
MAKQGAKNRTTARQQARQQARAGARVAAQRKARRQRHWWGRHPALSIVGALVVVAAAVIGVRLGVGGGSSASTTASANGLPTIGTTAPNFAFTTASGRTETVASLRGQPTLLWFVATWCSSCQAGTQFLAQQGLSSLRAAGVRVEEVELYGDLGQAGPSITQFRRQLAGAASTSADWHWGTSSLAMTERYDPKAYLDVYYLLDPNGYVRDVGSSPASTFSTLMGAVGEASTMTLPPPPPLASTSGEATGQSVDGITCLGKEQIAFHHHSHLAIYVDGQQRTVPYGVGIAPPRQVQQSPEGPFVTGGSCFYFLHTHTEDGIIHVESPVARTYTLGEFFDEWRQPLTPNQVGPARGTVYAYLNGKPWTGNPRDIPVSTEHNVIQLDLGVDMPPKPFTFPPGY